MLWVRIRVQIADRYGLDFFAIGCAAAVRDEFAEASHLIQAECLEHLTGCKHALVYFEGQVTRNQRTRTMKEDTVRFRPIAATDRINITRAARNDQRCARALAFDECVDCRRRAMNHLVDAVDRQRALVDAIDDALNQILRRSQALGLEETVRRFVECHQIGEGAADINSNDGHFVCPRTGTWFDALRP